MNYHRGLRESKPRAQLKNKVHHLLQTSTMGEMAVLSYIYKPTHGVKQNEETDVFQTKEQDKTSKKTINETEVPDMGCKVTIIKMLTK